MTKTKILLILMSAFFLFASIGTTIFNYSETTRAILIYGIMAGACIAFLVTEPKTKKKASNTKQTEEPDWQTKVLENI